jgi:hypothetical protein
MNFEQIMEQKDAEIARLTDENQTLKATLDTLIKDVAAAYMKALGPIEAGPAEPAKESRPHRKIPERDYESAT